MTTTIRILAWMALAAAAGQLARGFALDGAARSDRAEEQRERAGGPPGLTTEARRHGEEANDASVGSSGQDEADLRAQASGGSFQGDGEESGIEARVIWAEGFEQVGRTAVQPAGWHYLRGGRQEEDPSAPEGRRSLVFRASSPGRDAEVRRLFPLEGIGAPALTISISVRLTDVRPGQFSEQRPALLIDFVDDRGAGLGRQRLGPWHGTVDWTRHESTVPVAPRAAGLLLRIGLFGATGEAAFDALEIRAAEVNQSVFPGGAGS